MADLPSETVDAVRAFNRFYVQRMGLYSRNYLGTGLSVTDWRVLFEVADPAAPSARDIARSLDIDEAQISRILSRFVRSGWLARSAAPEDRRRKTLSLTAAGRAGLDAVSARFRDDLARRLGGADPCALVAAMDGLRRALDPGEAAPGQDIAITGLQPGDMGWLIGRHAEHYVEGLGYSVEFEALVAEILADFRRNCDPDRERAFIARIGGQRAGSVFCVRSDTPGIAKLRLFWVEPRFRGRGLGHRLVADCLTFARQAGYRGMTLWTHEGLSAARAVYARAGFLRTRSETLSTFGTPQVDESWEIAF